MPPEKRFLAAGCSDYGFEHSPLIGGMAADLVLAVVTMDRDLDLAFLSLAPFVVGRTQEARRRYSTARVGRESGEEYKQDSVLKDVPEHKRR